MAEGIWPAKPPPPDLSPLLLAGTFLQAAYSVQALSLHPPRVCSTLYSCATLTAESAAWCLGCEGLGDMMGDSCGSARQATPSPGTPLWAAHLQRHPGQSPFNALPGEAGAQRPGVDRKSLQERKRRRKKRMKRRCLVMPAHGPTAPPQMSNSEPDAPGSPRPPPAPLPHSLKVEEIPPVPSDLPTSLAAPGPSDLPIPLAAPSSSVSSLCSGLPLTAEIRIQPDLSETPQAAQETEPPASSGSQAQSVPALSWDEDTAQIGPKRIRKAAKRELLPCDFPGCGKIFSNRQYLNHHKKYQHIHQKSFSCPEPTCGKSFNFKKHLKEHVKLHSDTRDYICEFCARSFRTSSNLVIHRRIHTGEKPLQCEICGFTCRQKASLNWHRRKHAETAAALLFPCEFCGKRFEKPDSVAAHRSKSHPAPLPGPQESPGPLEPSPSISVSGPLGSTEAPKAMQVGATPSLSTQASALLPQK
ncbi:zinc finger protein 692 isoform X3 [Elephas maximus indicus]|uniref:zinc finger protein 692 isoform X3 n=1 Tax=Elephas maximus indicus TaxID=99487 RepID=UPI002116D48D|nr:zinc finger protein 692 isoform X3 [Elephas maximus indicus]